MARPRTGLFLIAVLALTAIGAPRGPGAAAAPSVDEAPVILKGATFVIRVWPAGFRYQFERLDGSVIAPAHAVSGIALRKGDVGGPVTETRELAVDGSRLQALVRTADGLWARVVIELAPDGAHLSVDPIDEGTYTIVARTGGVAPVFGLADHAAFGRASTELTGYVNERFRAESTPNQSTRLVSNFVIAPRQGFASINLEPGLKVVRLTQDESAQGSRDVRRLPHLHYFVGPPATIYQRFLDVRNATGHKVYAPKYEWFGVGWEAWGALAWDTNQRTVTENVSRYLELGYPLRWMVIGSGFWPRQEERFHATTSFGLWDESLYPNPKGLIDSFHQRGLKVILGLRISFIPDGPFAADGAAHGYFLKNADGTAPGLFKIGFPKPPAYLLDVRAPGALDWYLALCQRWLSFGVDGFKEDLYGFGRYDLRDDKIDPVNEALMDRGVYIMGRNAYVGSPADLHRFNDFNYWETQDRGPINGLALAYSGFPYVYPDIVGGTIAATETKGQGTLPRETLARYLMRNARYAALHPSMAMGYGPWNVADPEVGRVVLDAAKLHARLHPYIYSAAVDTHRTGFPFTMTPLTLAYPQDAQVYELENATRRGYEWLIGDALLATPLYGDDYATAESRDVYLPAGRWIDYDTGTAYTGPTTLKAFALPVGKTPLFVGRSGIVVEERDGTLQARVYPVANQASLVFHHRAGHDSRIRVDVASWDGPVIVTRGNGSGAGTSAGAASVARVASAKDGVAITFAIEPGVDYQVLSNRSGRSDRSPSSR
jgi:hypothetical protein